MEATIKVPAQSEQLSPLDLKGLWTAVHCRLRRSPDSNLGLPVNSLVSIAMSHHHSHLPEALFCSQDTARSLMTGSEKTSHASLDGSIMPRASETSVVSYDYLPYIRGNITRRFLVSYLA
jgi:hypothetical protein